MQLNLIASTNQSSIVSKSQVSFGGIDNLENNKKLNYKMFIYWVAMKVSWSNYFYKGKCSDYNCYYKNFTN